MIKKIFKAMEYGIILIVFLLFVIGIIALYSANGGIESNTNEVTKQIVWFIVGIIGVIILIIIDYDILGKLWVPLYIISIISLLLVLFTKPINGATSWFVIKGINIQPSEIGKIIFIIGLRKSIGIL